MTTTELKNYLLHEHERDKKLTIIYFVSVIIVALLIIGVAFYFLGSILIKKASESVSEVSGSEYGWYYKIAVIVLLVGGIGYLISKLMTLKKRPQQIDNFVAKVATNKRASDIREYVEYRITIPLGKVTYKTGAVNFVMVTFESEIKPYRLPLSAVFVPDLKTLLSGVNLNSINALRDELYRDESTTITESSATEYTTNVISQDESAELTPIKSKEEFSDYLKTNLSDSIDKYESNRHSAKKMMTVMGGISVILAVCFLGYIMYTASVNGFESISIKTFIPVIAIFVVYYIVYYIFIRPKQMAALNSGTMTMDQTLQQSFKTELFDKIIKFAIPDSHYIMHGHVNYGEFMESGMFRDERYSITGNDLVVGRFSGVPFQFCDLTVSHQKRVHQEGEEPDYALYGQFFVARFNKSFATPVYIVPRTGIVEFFRNNEIESYIDTPGEKIELEDPEFMKMFKIYGGDQVEARYILTPALMERIKNLAVRTKGKYYISFYNNKITVANNSGKNNFEVSTFRSIAKDDNKMLVGFYQDICDQLAIINDLKLNVRIWR